MGAFAGSPNHRSWLLPGTSRLRETDRFGTERNTATATTLVKVSVGSIGNRSGQAARLPAAVYGEIVCFRVQPISHATKFGSQLWLAVGHLAKFFRRTSHKRDEVAAS